MWSVSEGYWLWLYFSRMSYCLEHLCYEAFKLKLSIKYRLTLFPYWSVLRWFRIVFFISTITIAIAVITITFPTNIIMLYSGLTVYCVNGIILYLQGYFSVSVVDTSGFKELVRVPDNGEPSLALYTVMFALPNGYVFFPYVFVSVDNFIWHSLISVNLR